MTPRHVVEIGAGDSHTTEGLRWGTHARVSLYEPHPLLWADLNRAASGMDNVTVHHAAVSPTFAPLYLMGYASYLRGAPSFLATSVEPDGEQWWTPLAREVPVVKMDRVDHGNIDMLILSINGGERALLDGLVSRPQTILTRHRLHNARQWSDAHETIAWMEAHRYRARQTAGNQHGTYAALTWTLDSASQPA